MNHIVKAPPRALAPVASTDDARAQLAAARERLAQKLETVQHTLEPLGHWRTFVKRHPLATLGGAFLFGYALSRLFSRK
ncbi:MAG: hypothetical protein Q8L48_16290 [Archangium sp.]|nr:hypothetical protein [Archangium sp.]